MLMQRAGRPQESKLIKTAEIVGGGARVKDVLASLRKSWSLPWDNNRLEIRWLLALNGLPTKDRMSSSPPVCCCGATDTDRNHFYFTCPVAKLLRDKLEFEMQGRGLPVGAHLTRRHLWLGESPGPDINADIWMVVSLAALQALDSMRRLSFTVLAQKNGQPPQMQQPAALAKAKRQVLTKFWGEISDFCGIGLAPMEWKDLDHPFIGFSEEVDGFKAKPRDAAGVFAVEAAGTTGAVAG
jgi:hypothetical protein